MRTPSQRVVLSIGLAAILYLTAEATSSWAVTHSNDGRWFNYAPNSSVTLSPGPVNGWAILIWLVAAVLWTVVSLRIFRAPRDDSSN